MSEGRQSLLDIPGMKHNPVTGLPDIPDESKDYALKFIKFWLTGIIVIT